MGEILLRSFPLGIAIIFSVVGLLTEIWLFPAMNLICIGFAWVFVSASETISQKIINYVAVLLIALTGLLILHIAESTGEVIDVQGVVTKSVWSGYDDDMNSEYDTTVEYVVDGEIYNTVVITDVCKDKGDTRGLVVKKDNPADVVVFSANVGRIAGYVYLAICAVIVLYKIYCKLRW